MTYSTTDLSFAAYVIALGHSMKSSRREGRRVVFVFDLRHEDLDRLRNDWVSGTGTVAARTYADTLRSLKAAITYVG